MTKDERKAEIKQRILDIRNGWEWAFAHGARCAYSPDPRLDAVLKEERELNAELVQLQGE